MILYLGEIISKILGIVVFGYLGRTLLEATYGDLEFSLAWLFLFNLVIDAGLAPYGAREAAKAPHRMAELVGQIALVRTGLVIISILLLLSVSRFVQMEPMARSLILCQGLVLLPAPLVINWVFQSRDQMHVVAACSLLRQILFSVGVIWFVRGPADVLLVPVADAVGLSVAVLIQVLLYIRGGGGRVSSKHMFFGAKKVIAESLPLAGSSVVWALRLFFPLVALGLFASPAETGIFAAGHRLVIAAHQFVWLYFFNLLPSLSRMAASDFAGEFYQTIENSMRFVGWVAICGAGLGTVVAPLLLPAIYGEALAESDKPFSIMVWMLAIAFISGHQRFSLIAFSEQKREFFASVAGAMVSVSVCLAFRTDLTPIVAAQIFVGAELTTLIFAHYFLIRSVAPIKFFAILIKPVGVLIVAMLSVMVSAQSVWISAMIVLLLFTFGILLFERGNLRAIIELVPVKRR